MASYKSAMTQIAWSFVSAGIIIALLTINRTIWLIGISTVADDAGNTESGIIKLLLVIASWPWWVLALLATLALLIHLWHAYRVGAFIDDAKTYTDKISELEAEITTLSNRLNGHREDVAIKFDRSASMVKSGISNLNAAIKFRGQFDNLKKRIASLKLDTPDQTPTQGWTDWLCEQASLHEEIQASCEDKLESGWGKALLGVSYDPLVFKMPEGAQRKAYMQLLHDEKMLDYVMTTLERRVPRA